MCRAKQHLWSSVPQRDNLMSVALERNSKGPPEAEIGDLENPLLLIHQQVLRLQIPVKDAVAVAVRNTLAELVEKTLDEGGGHRPRVWRLAVGIDELLEISIKVLENQVEKRLAVLVKVLDAEEADDVEGLGEHLEEGDLTEGGGRDAFLVHFKAGLLESHHLAAGFVLGLVDLAVGAFTDLLKLFVFVHGGWRMADGGWR